MAIGRLSVSVGVKGKGGPHAQYIAREGKYAKYNDGLEKLEGTGYGNMPKWAQTDPNFFWKMSDDKERKNGTSYREHVIALPRELTADQRHELIKEWIHQEIGEKHAYQYAIHNPLAMDGLEQPHAHIMFSERLIDGIERDPDQYFKRFNAKNPECGGAKKANTPKLLDERKLELKDQRDRWEKLCNSHLELAGSDARISMKSLEEQGIDREPINLSMKQIKTPSIKSVYEHQLKLSIDLKQIEKDSQAINVDDELIRVYKEIEQNADRASERAREAIDTGRKVSDGAREALNGSGERVDTRKYAFTPLYPRKGNKNRDYDPVIEPSPWTDSGVEQAHIGLQRSKQLLDAINRELERDEIELKRRIRSKIAKEQSAKNPAPDKVAADKVAADKVAADKIAADKIAADKIAADKIAADKIAADKIAADKIAAD
ncbi:MobA/MobL family protein, partial [Psychrobacter sp. SIMBA_152]